MTKRNANIDLFQLVPATWKSYFDQHELNGVSSFLNRETKAKRCWQPCPERIFRPLELSDDPDRVKVCLIGQDPYPSKGVPTGLPFSVDRKVSIDRIPDSLRL